MTHSSPVGSGYFTLSLFIIIFLGPNLWAKPACEPFKVHLSVVLPSPPHIEIPPELPPNWETDLPRSIGEINTQGEFPRLYKNWLKENPETLSSQERYEWLECLLFYVHNDTNGNGIPDWSALVNNRPSRVLFPQDPDQDGDGIPNILDSDPLDATKVPRLEAGKVPQHLQLNRPQASSLQSALYKEFGILAVDHTDLQSAVVLQEVWTLFKNGFPKNFIPHLKTFKYIYAFKGHDPNGNIASFHWEASALSVAGVSTYPETSNLSQQQKIELLAALAHEIGHAFLLQNFAPEELAKISRRFGGWQTLETLDDGFYSKGFFTAFEYKFSDNKNYRKYNIVSQYALTNIHEWFAESFAALILNKLGRHGILGVGWQKLLLVNPKTLREYWVNYNNLTSPYKTWLNLRIATFAKLPP